MALSRRQKITIILLLVYWPALFVLAHVPIPQLVREAGVSDKCLHFLAYLILVFLLWFAASGDRKVTWRRPAAWLIFLVAACYGVVDELLQYYVGRSCDVMDFLANLAGALTGLVLFSLLTFWPASLLVAAIVIFGMTNVARASLADLLPVANAMFHLLGYATFTILWIQYMRLHLSLKGANRRWLLWALAVPAGFLLTVKLSSAIIGKDLVVADMAIALGGITGVVAATYLVAVFRKAQERKGPVEA